MLKSGCLEQFFLPLTTISNGIIYKTRKADEAFRLIAWGSFNSELFSNHDKEAIKLLFQVAKNYANPLTVSHFCRSRFGKLYK